MEHFDKNLYIKQVGKGNIKEAIATIADAITKLSASIAEIKEHLNIPAKLDEVKLITPKEILDVLKNKANEISSSELVEKVGDETGKLVDDVVEDAKTVETKVETIPEDVLVDVKKLMEEAQEDADRLTKVVEDQKKPTKKK